MGSHTPGRRGVFVDGTFHCGGEERTRWVQNLATNPTIVVHTESTESVVIVEGNAEKLTAEAAAAERLETIDDAYEAKYDVRHGTPVFAVHPERVLAWSNYRRTRRGGDSNSVRGSARDLPLEEPSNRGRKLRSTAQLVRPSTTVQYLISV